uniref:Uncharacterized protein n=1 Tax=Rhizophora mucronata TaxID=61149 RepID=A0A2P2PMR4_RHIMU
MPCHFIQHICLAHILLIWLYFQHLFIMILLPFWGM